ncbi:hypothetical protein LTR80_003360 [Exophiala xenobiotica]
MAQQQTITPYDSTEDMVALANHHKPSHAPMVYPLTPVVDKYMEPVQSQQWNQQNHEYATFMGANVSPFQPNGSPEMPLMINTSRQHWTKPQRPAMSVLPRSCSYGALSSFDEAAVSMQYMTPHMTSGEVNMSSVSVPATPFQGGTPSTSPTSQKLRNDEELSHLCRLSFILNLLVHIPIINDADVGEFDDMVRRNKGPLAYSMAYVAARFVPGCRSIRAKLIPEILSMLKARFDCSHRDDERRWMLMQAFAVLYTWATPQHIELDVHGETLEAELRQDVLKASMETLAMHFGVHGSGEEVVHLLKHNAGDIRQTFSFRKYCYWLWMFSSAHFYSLLTRTPPTIREDSSIAWANQYLEQYVVDDDVRRILADVSLCLLWTHSGLKEPDSWEWWCSISSETDPRSTLAVLQNLDNALGMWRCRWQRQEQQQPSSDFAIDPVRSSWIDFYQRFTRFCISTHVNKLSRYSAASETQSTSILTLVTQSVERASALCHLFLELSPWVKSSIRFAPESTFAMVAFCAEWVIQAKNFFPGTECVKPNDLTVLHGVAELMTDLGFDNKHSARVYGESILAKLNSANNKGHQQSRSTSWESHQDQPWATPSSIGLRSLVDSVTAMDGVWPLTLQNPPTQRPPSTGPKLGLAIGSADGSDVFPVYNNGSAYFHYDPSWSM